MKASTRTTSRFAATRSPVPQNAARRRGATAVELLPLLGLTGTAAEIGPASLVVGSALLLGGASIAWLVLQLNRRKRDAEPSAISAAQAMALLRGHPGIALLLEAGRVIEANDQAQRAYGYSLAELRALPAGKFQADASAPATGSPRTFVTLHHRKDGSSFPVEVTAVTVDLAHGRCLLQTCRDLSAEQEPRRQYERISQLYNVLRQLNQGMIRAESREELERGVCHALVGPGRFQVAWIGWLDPASAVVKPSALAGGDFAAVDEIEVRSDENASKTDPRATALREKRTCIANRLERDPLAPDPTSPQRLQSAIALPLHTTRGTAGLMCVYASQPDTFQAEEIALLEQCAADLCFAVDSLDEAASHQLAEERLVLLGSALEGAPSAIAISDQHDVIEWVNPAFLTSSGYTAEEVIGRNSRQLRAEHHPAASESELWRTISAGHAWHGELVSRRKNGQLYIEETSIVPVRDRSGRIRNFISIRQDVTGRKGAEQRVREQAALLDQASEAIVVADLNHRVGFWNRGAERLFGFTAVEAIGRQLKDVLPLESTIGSADFLHALTTTDDWRGEIHTHDREGEPRVIETSITMLLGDDGKPTGRLYFSADVTTKKALEEQFLRVQRMENIGMLAAGVAHDLNNILAPMRMVGPLLRDRLAEPRDLKLLDTLETCAVRGAALVRQILGFAQGVSGEPRTVQVKHLLRDIVDVITATFPKSIALEEEIPSNLWPINGNPTQIHQVLLNLCVNARDAMPEGGTLYLRARNCELDAVALRGFEGAEPGSWIVVEVQDTGTGITPEVLARMWEPLYTTKAVDKGTGLGLSTVRGLVVQHRGFVTVETEVGHGSTFRIHLPAENSAGESAGPETPAVKEPAKGELIMVVDDEPSVREVASTALTRHGYRVITAGDGAEAIAQFAPHATEIGLVITDIDMPNFDGAALCRVIHTLSPKTKLLVISGLSTGAPSDPPGVGFLAKPFDLGMLLQKTDEVLHGPSPDAADEGKGGLGAP